ncbi:MAG: S9 family peptidase [Planctomycetes bacterium]|nr:S9 family peptidase [Planctomycetota bacterium]
MPPETPKRPVTDVYHGVEVSDDYRWLEDWNAPEVKTWSDAQNTHARALLDKLPHVDAIRARVTKIMSAKTVSYGGLEYRQGLLFAIKREPPKQQPFLIVFASVDELSKSRTLVDPNVLDKTGATTIDWYVPSPNGRLVAVSLSRAGTEAGDVHIFDTNSGERVHEIIPRVNTGTAGGDLAWAPDASGFFYTRHPRPGERPPADLDFFQQVYFHKLGTPTEEDRYEIGKDFLRVAEINFEMHDPSGYLLVTMQKGDGGEFSLYLRTPQGEWHRISDFPDRILQGTFGPQQDLLLTSRAGAPRGKLLRVPLSDPRLERAETVIEEGTDTIVTSFQHASPGVLATDKRLYVMYQLGGPSELRVFDLQGQRQPGPEQLLLSSTGGLVRLEGDDVIFSNTSYVEAPAQYRFYASTGKTVKTILATDAPVDFRDVQVIREFAISKDGTKVPLNIMLPKGAKQDGKSPALVYGYGGYGISLTPNFNATRRVLLDQGVLCVVANLRGGGEYGEPWHLEGNLTRKQNVFDDFAAVLKHLVDRGYTSPQKMAIEGGSNGGLLMGALLTQHPELVRTVVSHVGIYDMLRVELSANGVFNIAEFGSVASPDQFQSLYAYSPYHHVQSGTRYPSVLFLTGANDPRVDPMQSRKMTARLQSVVTPDVPILLRTSSNSGHGAGTGLSERIEQTVDVFAFLFSQLGIEFKP